MIDKKRFLDEIPVPGKTDDSYDSITRQYSYNLQPEVNELLREFRTVLDDYTNKDGLERVMMTEGYVGNEELMEYYGNIDQQTGIGDISHMPINFCLLSDFKTDQFDVCPLKLKNTLCSYLDSCKEKSAWPNFSLGNHDCPRSTTRFGSEAGSFAMNALLLFLPGTPLTYYGEEIGMLDNKGEQSRKYYECGIFVKII